ncbi:MFS transporter [Chelativorans salis]|uniref:MFS transporter n=1 Tax=Chelativorans salis TaxID=2978478 RepID=A0ABT2LL57_9HYPH|nr:MFS transporter [Chelativorans sp. EGI FJ00035]MCT7375300.1 MFS transporter [Chelativorans sp. EGI FJ00035]
MAGIAALTAAYVLSQFYRSFLAVLTPALTAELGASKADLSAASGAWFALFALMQFAVGISLDRWGPRRTAGVLLGLCAGGGAFLFAFATAPWMVIAAMALIGMGCAPVLMASVFIFAKSFSPARLAVLTSWLMAIGTMGNVVGASPMAAAAEAFGWREVMAGLGVITLLVAGGILLIVRDPAREDSVFGSSGLGGYLELIRLRALWPIIPLAALNYAAAAGIRGLWAGPYLADVYSADALLIGQVTLFMALAMAAGTFIYGPLDTLTGTRKWVAVAGNTLGAAAVAWLAVFPLAGVGAATVALVLIGLTGGSYGVIMAHGRAFMPAHLTGRGVTLLNFFSIGGVGLMQFATGAVVTASTVPGEPAVAYRTLFVFYAGVLLASILVYLFTRDARPEPASRPSPQPAER